MNIDQLIEAARHEAPEVDVDRGFEATFAVHERRVARGRAVRRVLGAASAATILVVMLLRAGASSADVRAETETAAVASNDGGYAHD